MDAKTTFVHGHIGPYLRDQLGLRDNLTGSFKKRNQDVKRSTAQRDELARLGERALADIQLEWAEPKPLWAWYAAGVDRHNLFRQDLRRFDRCAFVVDPVQLNVPATNC